MKRKIAIRGNTLSSINYLLLVILGFITLYPFVYFIILSFNDGMDAMKGGIYFWPRAFTLANYKEAFGNPNIITAFRVSAIVTLVGTALSVILNAMAAFALTQKSLPGRTLIIFYFFITTLFGGGMIPFFILMKQLKLINTLWIYILPPLYNFFHIIIMRTFFDGIPASLFEAAIIDGCNEAKAFFKIYFPLSAPVLATIALFSGVAYWNDWFTGAFFVTKNNLKPLSTLLQEILTQVSFQYGDQHNQGVANLDQMISKADSITTPESLRMTFVVIITLPIMLIYPYLQKYFVKGVMVGAVKN